MSGNTFGSIFKLTTFGESHGPALGGVVDGCPAGIALDEASIQAELDKRRPGQGGPAATSRKEPDRIRLLSGVFEGRTTGTSIGFTVDNTDQRSHDYGEIKDVFRPGHGDLTYEAKYGLRDYRGGGRSSGRETVSRVAGGAVAAAFLQTMGIVVRAGTVELGGIAAGRMIWKARTTVPSSQPTTTRPCAGRIGSGKSQPEATPWAASSRFVQRNVPAGLGEPVFDKLDARLAAALMSVGAVKGVEIGAGFAASRMLGSENNDAMGAGGFTSNNAGGILAGISSGQDIVLRAAVKPIPSIALEQHTKDRFGHERTIRVGGRHDICAIPRIVPVLAPWSGWSWPT
jgi:chorismate synthase